MSVYYENNIQKKMVSVQLVIDASFCDVLQLQGMDYVNMLFVFLCRNYFGKPKEIFKIKKSRNVNQNHLYPIFYYFCEAKM